jgi:NAD(P)H-dependent nitrite reductase small subunit
VIARAVWRTVCAIDEILPDSGVAALIGDMQIAVFRIGASDTVYALGNHDPFSGANVLARGIVGDIGGVLVVASPIYKQHFRLEDGISLEDPAVTAQSYPARVYKGAVQVSIQVDAVASSSSRMRLVMVGNGMAGMRVIEELCRIAPDRYDITIFGAEPEGNYNRIMLSSLLSGECSRDDLSLHAPAWYATEGIRLVIDDPIVAIDRARRQVRSAAGEVVGYDKLLLAVGSSPNGLSVPGAALRGVTTFRDLSDVEAMKTAALHGGEAVVIGGGILGLEAAHGLLQRGMEVTVVHSKPFLMERQLDAFGAELLQRSLEQKGMKFCLGAKTEALEGDEAVCHVLLSDGSRLKADLVILAIGIAANVSLAREASLQVNRGILVDDTMQTFDPRIYAVGECCEHRGQVYGLVGPVYEQAHVCAAHLAGVGHVRYAGSKTSTALKVTGIQVFAAGDTVGEGAEELVLRDAATCVYKRLILRDDRLVGALMIGDATDGAWYHELICSQESIGPIRDRILFGRGHVELAQAA